VPSIDATARQRPARRHRHHAPVTARFAQRRSHDAPAARRLLQLPWGRRPRCPGPAPQVRLALWICELDPRGTIHVFNAPCERRTGISRSDASGWSWLELFAPGARADHGGRIVHDQRPGRTIFRLELPIAGDIAGGPLPGAHAIPRRCVRELRLSRLRIGRP
jgi:PAS domain-containing protein